MVYYTSLEGKSGQKLKQGRSLETGTDREAMEGRCLLRCLHSLLSLFSSAIQVLPALTYQSLIKTRPPRVACQPSYEVIFLVMVSSSRLTPACVKLRKN